MILHQVPPKGVRSLQIIQVIQIVTSYGKGVEGDPCRLITEYWTLEGEKLAEDDPYLLEMFSAASTASSDSM